MKKLCSVFLTLALIVTMIPALQVDAAGTPGVWYKSYIQKNGWQEKWSKNGTTSGTLGKSLRIETIQVKLINQPYTGGISYRAYVQKNGWTSWVTNGAKAGTIGESKRIEALQIKLTGEMAKNYDIYYCVYVQKDGWQTWKKNGEKAGTSGRGLRLEAIQIKLVKKDGKKPQDHQTTTEEQTTEDPGTTEETPQTTNDYQVTVNGVTFWISGFPDTLTIDPKWGSRLRVSPVDETKVNIERGDITWKINGGKVVKVQESYSDEKLQSYEGYYSDIYYASDWEHAIAHVNTRFYVPRSGVQPSFTCYLDTMFCTGSFSISVLYKGKTIKTCKVSVTGVKEFNEWIRNEVNKAEQAVWKDDMDIQKKISALAYYINQNYEYSKVDCKTGAQMLYMAAWDLGCTAEYHYRTYDEITKDWLCSGLGGHTMIHVYKDGKYLFMSEAQGHH